MTRNPTTTFYSIDGSMELACNYEGLDAPTIQWYHEGDQLSSGGTTTINPGEFSANQLTSTLQISGVTPVDNAGEYTCKTVFEDGDTLQDTFTVIVRTVNIVDKSENVISSVLAKEGELNLDCKILADTIPKSYMWYTVTGEAKTAINIDYTNTFSTLRTVKEGSSYKSYSRLTIKNFDSSKEGTYMCEFHYNENNPSATISVTFAEIETDVCVLVDYQTSGDKTLECTYHGTAVASKVQFISPDKTTVDGTLGAFSGGTQTGSYTYTGLTSSNDGSYKCSFTLQDSSIISRIVYLAARSKSNSRKNIFAFMYVPEIFTCAYYCICAYYYIIC